MSNLTKSALGLLIAIAAATDSAQQFDYVVANAPAVKALESDGLIEMNHEVTNDKNEVAARITDAGRAALVSAESEVLTVGTSDVGDAAALLNTAPAAAPRARKSFVIEDAVPLVEKTRAPSAELYPFGELEIGQSFFVANGDVAKGDAFKTLSSSVNTANDKYSEETGETRPHLRDANKTVAVKRALRKFELRRFTQVTEAGEVEGARVYRVALDA